jgi:hypothetical protein
MMWLWALSNWKLVVIGILSALLALTFNLWRGEARAFAVFKAQVEVLGKQAEAEARRVEAENRRIAKEMGDAWAKNLEVARDNAVRNYAARVRRDASRRAVSQPAAGAEAPAGARQESVAACTPDEQFIRDAAEDAARVEEAREFFRRHRFPTY